MFILFIPCWPLFVRDTVIICHSLLYLFVFLSRIKLLENAVMQFLLSFSKLIPFLIIFPHHRINFSIHNEITASHVAFLRLVQHQTCVVRGLSYGILFTAYLHIVFVFVITIIYIHRYSDLSIALAFYLMIHFFYPPQLFDLFDI